MFHRQGRRHDGITLIEMMIVLAIAAILAAVGVPQLYEYVVRNRIEAAANEFVTALNLARSEAIRRGESVAFRNRGKTTDWSSGWTMFADADRDGVQDAGEELIREGGALDKPMTMYSTRVTSPVIWFTPDGRVNSGIPDVHVFLFCYDLKISAGVNRPRSWAAMVNEHGRVRLAMPDASTGVLMRDIVGGEMAALPTHCTSVPSGK